MACLLVSQQEAERRLKVSLQRGYDLISLGNSDMVTDWNAHIEKCFSWADLTIEMLSATIDDPPFVNEIKSVKEGALKHSFPQALAKLEIILDRVNLGLISDLTTAPSDILEYALSMRRVFLVHGHDEAAKESVARFIEKLELQGIILHEQPNAGRTIIEKIEEHSNVGFAIILLTPDDIGASKDKPGETQPRARQNVILELGYFMGKLGRGSVCALYKEGVEIPSDYQGVLYIPMDTAGAWKMTLAKEIKNAGINVDLNKL